MTEITFKSAHYDFKAKYTYGKSKHYLPARLSKKNYEYLGVAFDSKVESFRNDLFDGYKTGEGTPPELFSQFPLLEAALDPAGFVVFSMREWCMQYTSLYRRYRPRRFSEIRGQDHVVAALRNAVKEDRVHHAYLLSGPRGTGKTTAAKLIVTNLDCDSIYINCSDENGIDTIREKVKSFASAATFRELKVVIMDEADRCYCTNYSIL